ncbi:MAG TPA: LptA/OstA family protein [Rectinemataceae bacterium]|nr:LptA/OstA family protein [Rectinemataceae bacterium]
MRVSRLVSLCALATACLCSAAAADSVGFSADSVQSVLAKGREHTVLSGHVLVKTGNISISADRIELFGSDFQFMQCSGSVVVRDPDEGITVQSPSLYYDRVKKLSRAEGPSSLEDAKNKLVLKAEFIENDGINEVMVAQVAVRILKEDLACRAEYAVYRRVDKQLELTGAPSATKKGDEYHATRIVVNTDSEEISLEGEVGGVVASGSASSPSPSSTSSPPPAPVAAPAQGQAK